MKCEYCQKAYNNGTARQKYCSEKCRINAKATRVAKPTINKECRECKKEFTVEGKSRNAVYCSVDCRKQRWKSRLVEKKCANCYQPFNADKRTLCCSTECKIEYFDTRVELNCIICGKNFKTYKSRIEREASQKCCSEECYRESRRTGKGINCYCDNCGKSFYKAPSLQVKHRNNFCSTECMGTFYSESGLFAGENSPSYIGSFEKHKKYYGSNWLAQRRKTRSRDNYTCQRCGITEDEYGQQLSVHHIVPFVMFKDYKEANLLDNLLSVCEPCHRKIHSGKNHHTKYGKQLL